MNVEASPEIGATVARRARALGALADPARLRVLDALVLGDASPGELGSQLGMSSSLLAHHLGVLEREGIVARHRSQADRRRSYLHLVPGSLDDLLPGATAPSSAGGPVPAVPVTRVVFVCTANSARSQLAAALWAQNSPVPGLSGGTHPAPTVAPGAAAVARRHGLRLDDSTPRLLPALSENDCLVTVCDNAHEELAPSTLATARRRLHWSVPDPVPAGTKQAFEDAYVDLEGRVITLALHLTPRATQAGAR
jgi:protein-tyrosine-phosphatase/DNA-binding transcriptional ArsR family regulator